MTPGCRTDWISNLFLNEGIPYVVVRHLLPCFAAGMKYYFYNFPS